MAVNKKAKKTATRKSSKKLIVSQTKAEAEKRIKAARKKARAELSKLRKRFLAAERKAKNMIKNNPEKALIIAAGVGVAIGSGVISALRRSKKK